MGNRQIYIDTGKAVRLPRKDDERIIKLAKKYKMRKIMTWTHILDAFFKLSDKEQHAILFPIKES